MLTGRGYRVLAAETPDAAIEIARQYPEAIDLLLTDVVMPRKSGLELARDIRAFRSGIRLLLMSGYTDNQVSSSWVIEPGTPFLQKPFTAASLTQKVRQALGSPASGL